MEITAKLIGSVPGCVYLYERHREEKGPIAILNKQQLAELIQELINLEWILEGEKSNA